MVQILASNRRGLTAVQGMCPRSRTCRVRCSHRNKHPNTCHPSLFAVYMYCDIPPPPEMVIVFCSIGWAGCVVQEPMSVHAHSPVHKHGRPRPNHHHHHHLFRKFIITFSINLS